MMSLEQKLVLGPAVTSFVDITFQSLQEQIRRGEEICPQVFFFGRQDGEIVVVPVAGLQELWQSRESKRLLKPLVKSIWSKFISDKPTVQLSAVVVFSDSWVAKIGIEEWEKLGRPLVGQIPERSEALVFQISLADGDITIQWAYSRVGKEIIFAEAPIRLEGGKDEEKGNLAGLWPRLEPFIFLL